MQEPLGTNLDYFNMRVMQRNLVYIIGIPQKYAEEDILRKQEFFGQFGIIKKVIINKRNFVFEPYNKAHEIRDTITKESRLETKINESTASAYITFSNDFEAKWCIQDVDESLLDGKVLRCTFGTTKYCSFYLKSIPCQNTDCMYLHESRPSRDILTKEALVSTKHKLHDFDCKNRNCERIGKKKRFDFLDDIIQLKTHVCFKPPRKILFEPIDFNEL